MAKENRKQETSTPQPQTADASGTPQKQPTSPTTSSTGKKSSRERGKNDNRPRVGGTAVTGAKSTLPKQISDTNNPQQQQQESYNREMRRRMERMGIGPQDSEDQMKELQKRRDKRKRNLERKKQRFEEQRQAVRRSSPISKITLGRKNLYFIIGAAAIVIILIVIGVLRYLGVF